MKIKRNIKASVIHQSEQAYIDKEWPVFNRLLEKYTQWIIDHRSSDNNGYLHYAVWSRNYTLMKKLIEAGADVNTQNGQGHTPLINACAKDDPVSTKILLDADADQKPRDIQGRDALHFAIFSKAVGELFIKKNKKKKKLRIKRR